MERFEFKKKTRFSGAPRVTVIVDTQTGVNYLATANDNGISGITPLLDENGKVVIDMIPLGEKE